VKYNLNLIFRILFLSCVIFLNGCDKVNKNDPTRIRIWHFKTELRYEFVKMADYYNKHHPEVKLEFMCLGTNNNYSHVLKQKLSSRNQPDIFNIGGLEDVEKYFYALADLSNTESAKYAFKETLEGVTKNKKIYGLPCNLEGYGLVYNKNIFKKAGIDPEEIKTYEDLVRVVQELDANKINLGIEAVFAYPGKETCWVQHSANIFLTPEFKNLSDTHNARELEFKYADAFKAYLDLQNKYSVQPLTEIDYDEQVEQLFVAEKVAMIQQGNWVFPVIYELDKKFAQNIIGMIPVPIKNFDNNYLPIGVPYYWAVNSQKSLKTQREAIKFLDWLNLSCEGQKIILEEFNFVPAYSCYNTRNIKDPLGKIIYKYFRDKKYKLWVFMSFPSEWGMNCLSVAVQDYLANKISWNDVIKICTVQWHESRK